MTKLLFMLAFNMSLLTCFLAGNLAYAQESDKKQSQVKQEYAENYVFADPVKRKEFLELTASLRCPKCQNQNIADSNAPISHDMRRKVYELMQQGNSPEQVIDWMKQRYGDFVYYKPPVNAATIWLWLIPVLFAFMMVAFLLRKRSVQTEDNIDEKLARAEQLLKDE